MVASQITDGSQFTKEYKKHGDTLANISLHWHDCFEFDIVQQGSGAMFCNGVEFPIMRGMVCFMSPMDFHEYRHCEQMNLINIQFKEGSISPELLNQFMMQHTQVIYVDEPTLANIESLCQLLGTLKGTRQAKDYDRKILECLIIMFLNNCKPSSTSHYGSSNIQHAVMYLNSHFRENPPMAKVAQMYSYDPNYFCRLFKKSVGVSYKDYVRKLKLNYGMKLVRFTDLSITEIASNCGYETQTHFNREFKAYYHAAPSTFR
ncbi:MAG: helix-turn-helix domain-containing protein [Clostridia bacterium]|nr:helix-turn-helix domain-containing protein [Clostridia bacterium]